MYNIRATGEKLFTAQRREEKRVEGRGGGAEEEITEQRR